MDKKHVLNNIDLEDLPDVEVDQTESEDHCVYLNDVPTRGRCRMNNVKLTGLGDDLWRTLRFKH